MTAWTKDELSRIDAADELEIAPLRRDGTLRNPTTIWVDAAYRTKYHRYAAGIVSSVVSPEARSATIKLVPRSPSS